MITRRNTQIDVLLDAAVASFDIPEELYELAVRRYRNVGRWFSAYWQNSLSDGEVYPQGSFRLGTVVRPIILGDQYDIDLVCRRDLSKGSITQAMLKTDVGSGLRQYVASHPEGLPTLHDGKRCWTLEYPFDPFHMDVLPAIPDPQGGMNAILLTDKELRQWQHSNPVDYATWFYQRMASEFARLCERAADVAKAMTVADVPEWKVKTTLQRTVQALKRHRDVYFKNAPEDRPASIIITTLAARSYIAGGNLHEVLREVAAKMPGLVERRDGVLWVPNPVEPDENFADRWRNHPNRAQLFFDWMTQVNTDVAAYGTEVGIHRILERVGKSLGDDSAKAAGDKLGTSLFELGQAGRLSAAPVTGLISTDPQRRPVPHHTFHGEDGESRSS